MHERVLCLTLVDNRLRLAVTAGLLAAFAVSACRGGPPPAGGPPVAPSLATATAIAREATPLPRLEPTAEPTAPGAVSTVTATPPATATTPPAPSFTLTPPRAPTATAVATATPIRSPTPVVALPNHLIAPHFVSSSPGHGDLLRQVPDTIAINFNFNLGDGSSMTVTRDGAQVVLGNRAVEPNKLTLRASPLGNTGDGLYLVVYRACWPDTSCHDGQFAFRVQSAP